MYKKRNDSRSDSIQRQSEDKATKGHGVSASTKRKDITESIAYLETTLAWLKIHGSGQQVLACQKVLECLKKLKKNR